MRIILTKYILLALADEPSYFNLFSDCVYEIKFEIAASGSMMI